MNTPMTQAQKDKQDALRYRKLRDGEEELPADLFSALEDGGEYLDVVVDSMPIPPLQE